MKRIGIIGAGLMGSGIALTLALFDKHVVLHDTSENFIEQAKKRIIQEMRTALLFKKSSFKIKTQQEFFQRIEFTTDINLLNKCDIIIENIGENIQLKKNLIHKIFSIFNHDFIYATNTSCISITELASGISRPDKCIGTHFMNPVPLIDVVEIVTGYHSSEQTLSTIKHFIKEIQKQAVIISDSPGFISNRLSHLFMNEAAFLIYENIATPKQVDLIFKKGYGHKMGPLETADLIGIDTVVNSLEVLFHYFQDTKFRCCPLLKQMVAANNLGKKTGKGFYTYDNI